MAEGINQPAMPVQQSMLVIIVGPKHSGKTSAGKALARLWAGGRALFVDLDELVERRTGKSPRLLYREGPECFRQAEAAALRALLGEISAGKGSFAPAAAPAGVFIAAAGGGIADNREALALLKKNGAVKTVYIEVPAETAWERIREAADRTGELPPFLNTDNPRETHRLLHERRGKIYRELAAFTVKAGDTPEETAAEMLRRLTRCS
ncbi:MAG: shikimate kinase [Treponema sp.]|jgi:shikimate kinase|nr:shikimate kinase [Treponema sp.]